MKVRIGPYKNWIGPYQVAKFFTKDEDKQDKIVDFFDKIYLTNFLTWIDSKKNRKIKVHIDRYDVWNADGTLAYIILPMLKMIRENKQGVPSTDEEDAPHIVCSENISEEDKIWNEERWNYILDEMIWAFEQLNIDWEDQYYKSFGKFHIENNEDDTHTVVWDEKSDFDKDGLKKHRERMTNGFRLFGKYFQSLWI